MVSKYRVLSFSLKERKKERKETQHDYEVTEEAASLFSVHPVSGLKDMLTLIWLIFLEFNKKEKGRKVVAI